jgi:hypothetical protein
LHHGILAIFSLSFSTFLSTFYTPERSEKYYNNSTTKQRRMYMKCPEYVKNALLQRAKAAEKFIKCDTVVVEWLEKNNMVDVVEDYDILTGCESLVNPTDSAKRILEAIENYEK